MAFNSAYKYRIHYYQGNIFRIPSLNRISIKKLKFYQVLQDTFIYFKRLYPPVKHWHEITRQIYRPSSPSPPLPLTAYELELLRAKAKTFAKYSR